ncbi:disks large-associated 4-like protein [Labeo rohita]|uniref:Disks large-associated 4-like protein n=1 Tax=Labeo rohita TaxID=84645 RepID=A0A498NQF7_LABRO|nr:disks large-associated 4-like protein [Labeo rohita]
MKGLGANRSRHLSDNCDPTAGPQEPLCPLAPDPHATFLLSPTVNHYATLDPHLHHFPQACVAQTGSRSGTLTSSMSMGMNLGLGLGAPAMISSGTATISSAAAAKMNRLPANLLDQLERHLPLQRDGFSTLQFHRRSRGSKQRSESPSRIRNLVQSVQKLFAKSQSLEVSAVKGSITAGQAGDAAKATRRSKSKDRAKTEGTKRRPRPNLSGFWSADDGLEDEPPAQPAAGPLAVAYRNPLSMMTLGRAVSDSQAAPRPHPQGYNTIAAHSLKSSKSSGDLKPTVSLPPSTGQTGEHALVKRGSWSTLTLSQARQVPAGDWSGTLGKVGGGAGEIPCRRMRSGSYVKAMGDMEDSDDSDSPPSPKPSPKTAARRQSYLKATQHSLSEQQPLLPPRNCMPSLCEVSTNRSLDNLDCLMGADEAGLQHWDVDGGFGQRCSTLGRGSNMSQVEQGYRASAAYSQLESQAVEALDLPTPTCFRSRSHSYLRAIQAGCSQDDDTGSVDSDETPPITSSISSYNSATISTCTAVCKKNPPPIPPRTTSKPYIAVTVQSSTESAQDTYLDSQDQRSEVNSQSGRSNSSDSIASSRTGSLVKGAKRPPILPPIPAPREPVPLPSARVTTPPPAIVPPSPAPDTKNEPVSLTVAPEEPQALPKRKLSSIGIQVDCVQPILKEEQTPTTRFQSIGVQVEDGRPLSRFTSMASRQETTDAESQEQSDGKPLENRTPHQSLDCGSSCVHKPSRADVMRTASASLQEKLDPALDPSCLPPPDPSLQAGSGSVNGAVEQPGGSACLRDGRWFQKLLQAETDRMEAWCQQMDQETKDKQLSEEVLGKVRSAVGSAQLLMSQKFQQFQGLCEQNLDVNAQPRPTAQDLAGFWDLLQLSIEDISMKFDELHLLRSNDWKMSETQDKKEEKKSAPSHTPKKTVKVKTTGGKEKSSDSVAEKQRQEARKRLMAAKRAVSERQNSATESAESIEIYVPEAQTRL